MRPVDRARLNRISRPTTSAEWCHIIAARQMNDEWIRVRMARSISGSAPNVILNLNARVQATRPTRPALCALIFRPRHNFIVQRVLRVHLHSFRRDSSRSNANSQLGTLGLSTFYFIFFCQTIEHIFLYTTAFLNLGFAYPWGYVRRYKRVRKKKS